MQLTLAPLAFTDEIPTTPTKRGDPESIPNNIRSPISQDKRLISASDEAAPSTSPSASQSATLEPRDDKVIVSEKPLVVDTIEKPTVSTPPAGSLQADTAAAHAELVKLIETDVKSQLKSLTLTIEAMKDEMIRRSESCTSGVRWSKQPLRQFVFAPWFHL